MFVALEGTFPGYVGDCAGACGQDEDVIVYGLGIAGGADCDSLRSGVEGGRGAVDKFETSFWVVFESGGDFLEDLSVLDFVT